MFNRRVGMLGSLLAFMVGLGQRFAPVALGRVPEAPPSHGRVKTRRARVRKDHPSLYCKAAYGRPVPYVPSIVRIDGIAHRHENGRLVPRANARR